MHCEMTGNNAFFVRDDVPGHFLAPDARAAAPDELLARGRPARAGPEGRAYVELDAGPVRQAHSEP